MLQKGDTQPPWAGVGHVGGVGGEGGGGLLDVAMGGRSACGAGGQGGVDLGDDTLREGATPAWCTVVQLSLKDLCIRKGATSERRQRSNQISGNSQLHKAPMFCARATCTIQLCATFYKWFTATPVTSHSLSSVPDQDPSCAPQFYLSANS